MSSDVRQSSDEQATAHRPKKEAHTAPSTEAEAAVRRHINAIVTRIRTRQRAQAMADPAAM
jgi:hypothetical protein